MTSLRQRQWSHIATTRPAAWLRAHRLLAICLGAAVVLRILAQVAYWPAVQFPDSGSYLTNAARPGVYEWHPAGYPMFLLLLEWTHAIAVVTILQHVLGIATALLLYRLLRANAVSAGWAALGVAPVLLDPIQIYLEQFVLSDVLFMFLVVLVLVLGLTRPPSSRGAIAVSMLIAYTTLVRTIGLLVAVPVAAFWLWHYRDAWRRTLGAAVAAAIPLLVYASLFDAAHGAFALQGYSGRWLYGRTVGVANCTRDHIPVAAKPLCPTTPPATRVLPSEFVWNHRLPYANPGLPRKPVPRSQLAGRFARDVIVHQPLQYLAVVARDVAHTFAPSRDAGTRGWFTGSWRFYQPNQPPFWRVAPAYSGFFGDRQHGSVRRTPARWLHDYERYVFTPGPGLALALVIVFVSVGYARRERRAHVAAVLGLSGLLLLVVPVATVDLDVRYVLSSEELTVAAAVIGGAAAADRLRERRGVPPAMRRVWVVGLGMTAAGLAVSNVTAFEAYADPSRLLPSRVVVAGRPSSVGYRLSLAVGPPVVTGEACRSHQVYWRVLFHLSARWRSGKPLLVAADDFYVRARDGRPPALPYIPFSSERGLLRPVLVSRQDPTTSGTFQFLLDRDNGTLVYVDPLGAGAAGWSFALRPRGSLQPLGTSCVGT